MSTDSARRVATAILVISLVLIAAQALSRQLDPGFSGHESGVILATIVGFAIYALVGRLIVSRQPANAVGWLLLAIPLLLSITNANGDYATRALVDDPGSLPLGVWSAWMDRWLLVPTFFSFIPIFLLYPDGRLPSPRWRGVLVLTIAAPIVTAFAFAVTPGRMTGAMAHLESIHVDNPLGLGGPGGVIDALTQVGGFAMLASAILACLAIITRYRRATPDIRQQIRWLALVGITFFVFLGLAIVLAPLGGDFIGNLLFIAMFVTLVLGIPAACGIAILRYHLYDLNVVVRKTVVVGAMTLLITAVYALIVGLGSQLFDSSTVSFVAAAVLAVGFQPARDHARRLADRLVYGKRATPYEVLAEFSGRVGEAYAADDVLPRMAQILAAGTGADRATVWLNTAHGMRPTAMFPPSVAPPERLPEDAIEVFHQGELLGALSVQMSASDPMDGARRKLVEDLAAQAGLVLRNVRLIEELRASRQRLVAAQDEERRKIERNIHDGAQQQLVALSVQLKLARTMLDRDVETAGHLLDGLQSTAGQALEELRDLARGIYPPLLADKGLVAALESQARKAAVPIVVVAYDIDRYPQETEAAVYFCVLEALNNVAKYANASQVSVSLARSNGWLTFTVTDDGKGFDIETAEDGTGIQGMADRLEAIGGALTVQSEPGVGTSVIGTLAVDGAS